MTIKEQIDAAFAELATLKPSQQSARKKIIAKIKKLLKAKDELEEMEYKQYIERLRAAIAETEQNVM